MLGRTNEELHSKLTSESKQRGEGGRNGVFCAFSGKLLWLSAAPACRATSEDVMDVALGYRARSHGTWPFFGSRIDMDVVRELTESDLEKLGLALGDRKRILKAIASRRRWRRRRPPSPSPARETQRSDGP